MLLYLNPDYAVLLKSNLLATFEHIWAYKCDWFEPPNHERGGWSGVSLLCLYDGSGHAHQVFMKRQHGFIRRTLLHPLSGEPTFLREFKVLQYLRASGVSAPIPVFFAEQRDKAVLMTQSLDGFVDWNAWELANPDARRARKNAVIAAIANMVYKMHAAGVQHRSLYPKHLFVNEHQGEVSVAIIDFEKSRISPWVGLSKLSDLITLNYRTSHLSRVQRLYFFKQYLGVARLSMCQKLVCCYIYQQSLKKSSRHK